MFQPFSTTVVVVGTIIYDHSKAIRQWTWVSSHTSEREQHPYTVDSTQSVPQVECFCLNNHAIFSQFGLVHWHLCSKNIHFWHCTAQYFFQYIFFHRILALRYGSRENRRESKAKNQSGNFRGGGSPGSAGLLHRTSFENLTYPGICSSCVRGLFVPCSTKHSESTVEFHGSHLEYTSNRRRNFKKGTVLKYFITTRAVKMTSFELLTYHSSMEHLKLSITTRERSGSP